MALLGGTAGWVRGLGLGEERVRDQRVAARQACGRVDRGVDGLRKERLGRWERGSSGLVEHGVDADGDDDGGDLREGGRGALQVSFGLVQHGVDADGGDGDSDLRGGGRGT